MYAGFFGLDHEPFSIAPDPRYLYMSERHREALAHLLYGVKGGGGFVLLTGEIGAGKTTVCRAFLEQVPKRCNVAYVFNPKLSAGELLQTVLEEFRIPPPAEAGGLGLKAQVDALNEFLLRTHAVGQNNVLIIDEAQGLSAEVLEQLRLLTNLETAERKLLQIILIGQPELRTLLAGPSLEQLAQRVIARYHLQALSPKEAARYVQHRLQVAGLKGPLPFDRAALLRLHQWTGGVPRRLNLLADRALLGAYAVGRHKAGREMVDKAAREVFDRPVLAAAFGPLAGPVGRLGRLPAWGVAAAAAAVGGIGLGVVAMAWWGGGAAAQAESLAPPRAPAAVGAASRPSAPAALAAASAPTADAAPSAIGFAADAAAFSALAAAWSAPAGTTDCGGAAARGLQCFRRPDADLALLRRLGRPALVTLQPAEGAAQTVLLVGLSAQQVRLQGAGGAATWPLARFEAQWKGDLLTLWQAPPGYAEGSTASAWTPWVAAQLPAPASSAAGTAETGEALRGRVRSFQSAQGLKADGVAGPVTLMQLNRAAGIAEPRLEAF